MPSKRSDPFAAPLAEAARSLEAEPGQAERRAREVLSQNAADPRARLILGAALRRLGAFAGAREVLAILTRAQPNSAHAHLELGLTLEALGDHAGAVAPLARVVTLKPTTIEAWRALAHSMAGLGDLGGAANALRQGLRHAPASSGAAYDLAVMLHRRQDDGEALALAEALVSVSPDDEALQSLLAACAVRVGDYVRATALYRALLERHPEQPELWLSLGHALRAQGDRTGATHAYRRCVAVSARSGEAYWSLANLKSSHLVASDEEDLRAQLQRSDLEVEDSLHLNYALARLLEEADRFEESFEHYSTGAALCRQTRPYDAEAAAASMAQTRTALVTEVFDWNETPPPPSAPIFIVGLPRSGSTLIEQILASHSAVEGCGELPTMVNIARDLAARSHGDYPASLVRLLPAELIEIGNRYMAESRFYRRRDDARSVDKMPNNFHHLGLIRLALPGAKIIDARRSPMAAGFFAFQTTFRGGSRLFLRSAGYRSLLRGL